MYWVNTTITLYITSYSVQRYNYMLKRIRTAIENIRQRRIKPLHIEFNLTDYCNLNCKGCSHYSPVAEKEFLTLEELEISMKAISGIKNVDLIKDVYLIGGETLLYPQLTQAMRMARKYFPSAGISIYTNGLLIPKMQEEFWQTCRDTYCGIQLTRYPVKVDYGQLEALCKEKGVRVEVFGDRGEDGAFFKFPLDSEKKQNGSLSHFRCGSFGCVTVDRGRIFPCPQSACINNLNRRFGTNFKWEKGDFIDVKEVRDAMEILRLRNKPVPFCKYCKPWQITKYGPSKRTVSEWI